MVVCCAKRIRTARQIIERVRSGQSTYSSSSSSSGSSCNSSSSSASCLRFLVDIATQCGSIFVQLKNRRKKAKRELRGLEWKRAARNVGAGAPFWLGNPQGWELGPAERSSLDGGGRRLLALAISLSFYPAVLHSRDLDG